MPLGLTWFLNLHLVLMFRFVLDSYIKQTGALAIEVIAVAMAFTIPYDKPLSCLRYANENYRWGKRALVLNTKSVIVVSTEQAASFLQDFGRRIVAKVQNKDKSEAYRLETARELLNESSRWPMFLGKFHFAQLKSSVTMPIVDESRTGRTRQHNMYV